MDRRLAHDPSSPRGGKAIYGAPLGILMLEAKFPRIPGDMGNAATWPFPVLYRVVSGASPERVVLNAAAGLLDDFLAAAADLVAQGAEAITTNCGFLSAFQRELAAHVGVPVATSALLQVPWVQATLPPGKRVGHHHRVGTVADAPPPGSRGRAIGYAVHRHRGRAGVLPRADPGREAGHGHRPRRRGHPGRRPPPGRAATRISAPSCWNAPTCRPTRTLCVRCSGLPVYDIYSLITWLHAGLRPRDFGPPADRATCLGGQ